LFIINYVLEIRLLQPQQPVATPSANMASYPKMLLYCAASVADMRTLCCPGFLNRTLFAKLKPVLTLRLTQTTRINKRACALKLSRLPTAETVRCHIALPFARAAAGYVNFNQDFKQRRTGMLGNGRARFLVISMWISIIEN
jgi:hypothetical protein